MPALLALPAALALAVGAEVQADLALRADGRSSTVRQENEPTSTRAGYSVSPQGIGILDATGLRLAGSYALRLWTTDAALQAALLDQVVELRLVTHHAEPWNVGIAATATQASTDPLTRPNPNVPPGQLASTDPVHYLSGWAGAKLEVSPDVRNTVTVAVWAYGAQGTDDLAREIVPLQRTVGLDASEALRATERDALQLDLHASWTRSEPAGASVIGGWATASATWRRKLTPRLDGWLGGGMGFTAATDPTAGRQVTLLPVAELGVSRAGEVTFELSGRALPFVDPYSGQVRTLVDARLTFSFQVAPHVSLSATATAGARADSVTALATGELRVRWQVRPALSLEAAILGYAQRDDRPPLPSFLEVASMIGMVWGPAAR